MLVRYTTPMPPTPKVVLEIDDNTPAGESPFSCDVSMWSFDDDLNLATRTGAEVFREMHKAADSSRFRGYPDRAAQGTVKLFDAFVDASEVTWLTVAELGTDRPWLPRDHLEHSVVRSLHALFGAIDAVAAQFGTNRVRLVFAFV
jgi:hypothetical protein